MSKLDGNLTTIENAIDAVPTTTEFDAGVNDIKDTISYLPTKAYLDANVSTIKNAVDAITTNTQFNAAMSKLDGNLTTIETAISNIEPTDISTLATIANITALKNQIDALRLYIDAAT